MMVAFLDRLWERTRRPGDLADLCGMCRYIPGHGSYDRAMWYDWLATVRQFQTGVPVPENGLQRGMLTADMVHPLDPEQAYRVMLAFIEEYWRRVNCPDELGRLLARMRYTPGAGSADPAMWPEFLATFKPGGA